MPQQVSNDSQLAGLLMMSSGLGVMSIAGVFFLILRILDFSEVEWAFFVMGIGAWNVPVWFVLGMVSFVGGALAFFGVGRWFAIVAAVTTMLTGWGVIVGLLSIILLVKAKAEFEE